MPRFWFAVVAAFALQFGVTAASADEAAEKMVDDALPYMYHSCESVVEEAAGNEGYIDTVVRAMVAVSLYNRDVEISAFEISDEQKNAMHDKFVDALKKGCEADRKALLAGIIDTAVADALANK